MSTAINQERLLAEFQRLVGFDAESRSEQEIAAYLKEKLAALGLEVSADGMGNLFGRLEGTGQGEPILFSSHMDTVAPGVGKRAVFHPDGRITSDGTTVLGADDASGLAEILEALTVIRENALPHPELEVLFPVQEELYGKGSAAFDFSRIRAKTAYVLDLSGRVGTAAIRAPSILTVNVTVLGRASHAGFAAGDGINALTIAANALSSIETGQVEDDLTVNFGTVSGGTGTNIVPAEVRLGGEIRSLSHPKALSQAEKIRERFQQEAEKRGGRAEVEVIEEIRAFHVSPDAPVVERLRRALSELGQGEPVLVTTFGGSDNNNFALHGISGVVLACGMEKVHTLEEFTEVSELVKAAELTLKLMTLEQTP